MYLALGRQSSFRLAWPGGMTSEVHSNKSIAKAIDVSHDSGVFGDPLVNRDVTDG